MLNESWAKPSEESVILNNTAHVWLFSLIPGPERLDQLKAFLSADEINRANRFKFDKHRRRFIAAHGLLKLILAKYLGKNPADIYFITSDHGKPYIEGNPVYFNLSHSNNLGLAAICGQFEIGVDIEYIRPEYSGLKIARRFFSEAEINELLALPEHQQTAGFFNCWSRKEAYIKARGKGLAIPLSQFDVNLTPGKPARLLATRDNSRAIERWKLHDLFPHSDYAAAVAVHPQIRHILCWNADKLF